MGKRVNRGSAHVAVAYVRVSTDEQRLGPEAQRMAIESWALREGVNVAAWHIDLGVSSVTAVDERPALSAALVDLRACGAGVLVVAKRDRIARDVVLSATIERAAEKAGARLVSAAGEGNGDGPADQFLRTVVDGAAQYERALIRARTTAALAVIRSRGHKTGGDAPYGYSLAADGRTLVPVDSEQATIARARALAGSLRTIAEKLAEEGRLSRLGKPFAAMQVSRMRRPLLAREASV